MEELHDVLYDRADHVNLADIWAQNKNQTLEMVMLALNACITSMSCQISL
jgi:hypothetical protein